MSLPASVTPATQDVSESVALGDGYVLHRISTRSMNANHAPCEGSTMPLTALSPEGPISLARMELSTIEALKDRNRREKLFTAKCCGAPLQIRTPQGRVPHFYHLTTTPGCAGGKGESEEHIDLKLSIEVAAIDAGWSVELEYHKRDSSGALLWRADVLASNGRATVAFEVELSHPDWSLMMERQERYKKSGVRGLWFVRTRKPFPTKKELPVFNVSLGGLNDWVSLERDGDWADVWAGTSDASSVELRDFVNGALNKRLRWAPYMSADFPVPCNVAVRTANRGRCPGCNHLLAFPDSISMSIAIDPAYPRYVWHRDLPMLRKSHWTTRLCRAVRAQVAADGRTALLDPSNNTCLSCGATAKLTWDERGRGSVTGSVDLSELPRPRMGTIEWDWLNRWVFQPEP